MHTKDKYHLLNYCSTVWVLGCRIHEFPTLVLVKSVKAPELVSKIILIVKEYDFTWSTYWNFRVKASFCFIQISHRPKKSVAKLHLKSKDHQ